ncbi:uncharacterized protein [Gossypium hirsutum]|uniref:MULE transposase domain-containing protein n=1 Tax=Gossypium hirsutum TaxID=3635 RepID=A0A1U8JJK9_GOSHI|nr:uncharacterized protein LOC107907647 [Gossypium hirsutum]
MFGSDVPGSDASENDVSNRIRVNLDGLNMDGIEVDELCDSDDSGRLDSAHESDLENDMSNPRLKVGMLFKSKSSLKEAAKHYGRLNSYFIKFPKNDLKWLKTVYSEKCSWFIWASRLNPNDPTDQTWQIRSSNPNHTCSKVYKNKNVTSAWIGEHYKEKFIADPDYSMKSLQQDVKRDLCCIVSLTKCRRAKLKALELIKGAHKAQYEKIYEYLLEVRMQNEGSATIYYLDNRLFQRIYVYLQACKDGYKAGCRRIVGLDGCFLKGYYGVYLLATIGIDANNGSYPIAYVAVESENQAPWLWFLELLAIDLEIMILEARGKPILTMMEIVRTKIMLLIVKKEEDEKWKGTLCVPSHAGGDKYQVEYGPSN